MKLGLQPTAPWLAYHQAKCSPHLCRHFHPIPFYHTLALWSWEYYLPFVLSVREILPHITRDKFHGLSMQLRILPATKKISGYLLSISLWVLSVPPISWGTEGSPGFLTEIHTQYLEMLYLNCVSSLVSILERFCPTKENILKKGRQKYWNWLPLIQLIKQAQKKASKNNEYARLDGGGFWKVVDVNQRGYPWLLWNCLCSLSNLGDS